MKDKLLYMLFQYCEDEDDLLDILTWIHKESIEDVYHALHYMFLEDDVIRNH